jgi:hypothetical protein
MTIRNRLAIALLTFLVSVVFAGIASAQAGDPCVGTSCGLGGQIRAQIGKGLPLPISVADERTGPFVDITIQTGPATPDGANLRGDGLGQPGQIKPTTSARVNQTTAHPHTDLNPRGITLIPGNSGYGPAPEGSIGVLDFNTAVFAVQTQLIFDTPHPETTVNGGPVNVPGGVDRNKLFAGGRPGGDVVSYCAGALGNADNNFNNSCTKAADGDFNGLARFTKTKNQFGGVSTGRVLGTAKVYFNIDLLTIMDMPCTGCKFGLSTVVPGTTGVAGGPFGGSVMNPAFQTQTGVYTGTLGFNGSILNNPLTNPIRPVIVSTTPNGVQVGSPYTGQPATSVGFPLTTGMITISVTAAGVFNPLKPEVFKRTGTDARDANGNGVIALNTGAISSRTVSKGNANRVWTTLEIPEPSAILAASAGLFALFGCHQLVRRRSR